MIALLQRVISASVDVDGDEIARINQGLLALIGIEKLDDDTQALQLVDRVIGFRLFDDAKGRMNLDVRAAGAEILVVPQFTLAADTSSGRRPGFSTAASPDDASVLFDRFCELIEQSVPNAGRGVFGAHMRVSLINDGPATFWLQTRRGRGEAGGANG